MKITKQDKKARNEKAATILRTLDKKDLAQVAAGACGMLCGIAGTIKSAAE
jgi:hypothetical protein